MEINQVDEDEDEGPPPGYQSILPSPQPQLPPPSSPLQLAPQPPPPPLPPSSPLRLASEPPPPPSSSPLKLAPEPPPPMPTTGLTPMLKTTSFEIAQMICGHCRTLLKYPPGARQVLCSCCQTVNFVLEAHQVGQVKCGGCTLLLMYPYGSSKVRCSSCQHVTEIGVHNERPPWSVQQGQPPPGPNQCY
ncbi:protein LOL2-like [Humulus lupulus]|uniref:protein LOL2-like n=1 Tax=Humulus lupulus TaxID=3486 RepID=UPI002B40AE27|nr:protein LOL2-like [Humulus lupulus]